MIWSPRRDTRHGGVVGLQHLAGIGFGRPAALLGCTARGVTEGKRRPSGKIQFTNGAAAAKKVHFLFRPLDPP